MQKIGEQVRQETEGAEERSKCFLEAWKKGIKLAGKQYFKIAGDLEGVTDKWDLKPDKGLIEHSLHQISKSQAIFLATMYSFYDGEEGQIYLEQLDCPNICDIAAKLDKEYSEVVGQLFVNYSGW